MASEGRETISADGVDDPVGYFLDDLTYHGRSERTRAAYERVLRAFEAHLAERGATADTADRRDCLEWVHELRASYAPSTVATYASYCNRFYRYMTEIEALDGNPMSLVVEEMDESIDADPARREVSVAEMRSFVRDVTHPLERAVVLTLLKTGVRVGELCNLDLRDLSLTAVDVEAEFDVATRGALSGRPDSLFVASSPSRGSVVNGEERSASNKRQRDTVIPVDDELASVLARWLAIRPDARSPARPLFCSTSEWGRRLTPGMARDVVRRHASANGWHQSGGEPAENVTPHYFRHFFTTHLRDRTGDRGVVKYLRGDVADDVIDTYTHNWGDRVRERYEESVYSLL
ncbi:MAG: tyrosine-type recombinase/integrase [Halobacteriaceae archaeon]